jgi:hypothetical protein
MEELLAWIRADIKGHNLQVARQLPAAVAQRKAKLLRDRGHPGHHRLPSLEAVGCRHAKRSAQAQEVNTQPSRTFVRARQCLLPRVSTDNGDYEAVLAVLRNACNAPERSPSITAKLGEEQTRDLLLVMLNRQFEGKAAGAVSNCLGKTDILVGDGDRNVRRRGSAGCW